MPKINSIRATAKLFVQKKKKGLMPNDAKPYLNYNSDIYREEY